MKPFPIKHIDNSFYHLTATQAKLLSIDGELPKDGYEKKAKPGKELNQLVYRLYWNWRTSFPSWKEIGPINEQAQSWISKTRLSWHDGKRVENGWIWAIHIWEPI